MLSYISTSDIYVFIQIADPTYVVTPAMRSRSGRDNLKKLFAGMSG